MKKLIPLFACLLMLTSCFNQHFKKSRDFNLTYTTYVKDIPENSKNIQLWIPVPQDNSFQKIKDLSIASFPAVSWKINTEEKYNNKMIHVNLKNPPKNLKIDMTMNVTRWENASPHSPLPNLSPDATLKANRLVPINQQTKKIVRKQAGNLTKPEEIGQALAKHTLEHMAYDKSGDGWGLGNFQHACDVGRGNCTDFHAYFISLCRSAGVPAYFEIGLPLNPQRGEGKTGGYHCWAYYHDGNSWVPVDISEADKDPSMATYFLNNHCENRVAFSIGRDIVLAPRQNGEPLNYFIAPYAEVDGKEFLNTSRKTMFKDN